MEKKSKILIIIIAAVAVIAVAVAVVLALGSVGGGNYSSMIDRGQAYLESKDYDRAIEAFKKALELDDTDEEAYIGLAHAYYDSSLFALAKQTLTNGLLKVDSSRIRLLLNEWFGEPEAEQVVDVGSPDEAPTEAQERETETETFDESDIGVAQCILQGKVTDAASGSGVSDVKITAYLGYSASGTPYETKSDSSGNYVLDLASGNYFVVFEKDGYKQVSEVVYVYSSSPKTYKDCTLFEEGLNVVRGRVIDAATGMALVGAKVTAHSTDGGVIDSTVTDSSGEYSLTVKGYYNYYITIEMDGYIAENINVVADSSNLEIREDAALSEELEDDVIRIVLTWGSYPVDLDSYVSGTSSDGTNTFIKFSHRTETDRSGDKIAELDLDDRDGYGPETTTIYDIYGSYEFYVVDYYVTESLAAQGATVKVYRGNSLIHTIDVASDVVNVWSVLRINNGNVEVTNCNKDITLTPGSK